MTARSRTKLHTTYVLFQRIRQTNNTTCSGSLARNEDLRLSLHTANYEKKSKKVKTNREADNAYYHYNK